MIVGNKNISENKELQILKDACCQCTKCPLSKSRINVVFGSGNPNADVMIIGEAPGAKEDESGMPFVGSAGKNLSKFLSHINTTREEVFIANIIKCRPPNNRNPNIDEVKTCTPWLIEQISLIKPKVICTLGNYSTKFVLSKFNPDEMKKIDGISKLHGQVLDVDVNNTNFTVIPLYHPAALIYNRKLIPDMYKDLEVVAKVIGKEINELDLDNKNNNNIKGENNNNNNNNNNDDENNIKNKEMQVNLSKFTRQ